MTSGGLVRRKSDMGQGSSARDDGLFAEELLSNLRGDMSNSNYMHAFCGTRAVSVENGGEDEKKGALTGQFDVSSLSSWETALPQRLIGNLVSKGEISEKLTPKPQRVDVISKRAMKQLDALVKRSKEEKKDFGHDSLRIGFPLIEIVDDKSGKAMLCPLVLWKVRLDLVNRHFVLSREFDDVVELNDALCRYLATERDIHIKGDSEKYKSSSKAYDKKRMINDVDIESLLLKACPTLKSETVSKQLSELLQGAKKLSRVPASPEMNASSAGASNVFRENRVIWGAVLAMFKTGNPSVLKDLEGYVKKGRLSPPTVPILGPKRLQYSALELDPSQHEAILQLSSEKNLVINGPPGTGKSQTLTSLIACAGANGLKTLVVCEKKTPLQILQRNLGLLRLSIGMLTQGVSRANEEWGADKFSCIITNVQEREDVVARAQRNKSDIENLQLSTDTLDKLVSRCKEEIFRLQSEVSGEEQKFARHNKINEKPVSFGMTVREAIAYVIKKKLAGNVCLTLPENSDIQNRVFAPDHLMKLDRCEETIPRATLSVLRLVRFDKLLVTGSTKDDRKHSGEIKKPLNCSHFDAEVLVEAAKQLRFEIRSGLERRAKVVSSYHAALIREQERQLECWTNHHEDLVALQGQLRSVPSATIQSSEAPPRLLDSILGFFGSEKRAQMRYFHSALNRVQDDLTKLASAPFQTQSVVMPTNFNLSNINRLVNWCLKHRKRAAEVLEESKNKTPLDVWNSRDSNEQGLAEVGNWGNDYSACNAELLASVGNSAFSMPAAMDRFAEIFSTHCDYQECVWAVDKELLPFLSESLSSWREATDSIDCLVESGLISGNPTFFENFLDISKRDSSSWGSRLKLCILAKELEGQCKQLITSDFALNKLSDCHARIKRLMQELLILQCAKNMKAAIDQYEQQSSHKFEQFYNRGSKNIRASALREIVKDLDLFTSCFPVLFCTPEVASTLFRWRNAYFDLVIVDEASQSLPHNTFCALLKAKKVVIAGDSKQMPPSTLFNARTGNNVFDDLEIEDESAVLEEDGETIVYGKNDTLTVNLWNGRNAANAESLLDYATDHSFTFKGIDLRFHYRSTNPDLMRFHRAAVYPLLSLCPERAHANIMESSKPASPAIVFNHVNGTYKDQCNKMEAAAIMGILKDILQRSEFSEDYEGYSSPSIAVATFNEVQKNEVMKAMKEFHDPTVVQKLRQLQSSKRFFVKNLENLQGDEVDILIVSITFGPNAKGNFDRRFGRITFTGIGYRYLNVLFSRAKSQVYIVSSVPQKEFKAPVRILDETGTLNGVSFLWGYLAYGQAISEGDRVRAESILQEFSVANSSKAIMTVEKNDSSVRKKWNGKKRRIANTSYTSLERVIFENLKRRNTGSQVEANKIQYEAGSGTLLRGIIIKLGNNRKLIIECNTYDSYRHSIYRKGVLASFGYEYYQIWPANWLDNPLNEFEKLRKVVSDIRRRNRSYSGNTGSTPRHITNSTAESGHIEDMSAGEGNDMSDELSGDSQAPHSPFPIISRKRDDSVLEKPFLVKYGNKRKYIVFRPEKYERGSAETLVGNMGKKRIKIAAGRLEKLRPGIARESFVDEVEYDMANHFLQSEIPDDAMETTNDSFETVNAERLSFERTEAKEVRKSTGSKGSASSNRRRRISKVLTYSENEENENETNVKSHIGKGKDDDDEDWHSATSTSDALSTED